LSVDGINDAVDHLLRRGPAPVKDLSALFPDFSQLLQEYE